MLQYELFFGRSVPTRADVTDKEWDDFVDQVVLSSLPKGFTLLESKGAWVRPEDGRTMRENGKVLIVAVPRSDEAARAVRRIRSEYGARFHQQLVGLAVMPVCGSF